MAAQAGAIASAALMLRFRPGTSRHRIQYLAASGSGFYCIEQFDRRWFVRFHGYTLHAVGPSDGFASLPEATAAAEAHASGPA